MYRRRWRACDDLGYAIDRGCIRFCDIIDIGCNNLCDIIEIGCVGLTDLIEDGFVSFAHFTGVDKVFIDYQLFKRAFFSMGYAATPADIQKNIAELTSFRNSLQNSQPIMDYEAHIETLLDSIFSSREIFGNGLTERFRKELIRECNVAIFFQRTLSVVNTFYKKFNINGKWVNQFLGDTPSPFPTGTIRYNNNALPAGTVKYVLNSIPPLIFAKAQEIATLRDRFDDLVAAVKASGGKLECPPEYIDYNEIIMKIPVFSAMHPRARESSMSVTEAASIESSKRGWRHAIDSQTFEGQFRAALHNCSYCNRPIMNRDNMLIDTDLQDQILAYLRKELGISVPAENNVQSEIPALSRNIRDSEGSDSSSEDEDVYL